jgi:hypothetical protein
MSAIRTFPSLELTWIYLFKKKYFFFSKIYFFAPPNQKLGSGGDVNLGDVSQLWTSLGLERQRLDDLLELVSIATTPPSTKDEEGGQDLETEENGESGDGKEGGGVKEPRSYDPAAIVDWNKLLALAAGQLGDVNTRLFSFIIFPFVFSRPTVVPYQNCVFTPTRRESIKAFAHRPSPFPNLLADGPTAAAAAPDSSSHSFRYPGVFPTSPLPLYSPR